MAIIIRSIFRPHVRRKSKHVGRDGTMCQPALLPFVYIIIIYFHSQIMESQSIYRKLQLNKKVINSK